MLSALVGVYFVGLAILACFGWIFVEDIDPSGNWSIPEWIAAWLLWPLVLVFIILVGLVRLFRRGVSDF
jgi:hypothetical protein